MDKISDLTALKINRRHALERFYRSVLLLPVISCLPKANAVADTPNSIKYCPEDQCGWFYDPAIGDPDKGIGPGLPFEQLPDNWTCPTCGTPKQDW